jgi:hypothetical protein
LATLIPAPRAPPFQADRADRRARRGVHRLLRPVDGGRRGRRRRARAGRRRRLRGVDDAAHGKALDVLALYAPLIEVTSADLLR